MFFVKKTSQFVQEGGLAYGATATPLTLHLDFQAGEMCELYKSVIFIL